MKTAFITLTNKGYLPYTLNCLKSLHKIGINHLKSYAIGEEAYQKISSQKYAAEHIHDESNTTFQVFRQGNWAAVTFYKFEIIYENLKNNDFVCFTDGDIVFKKPGFLNYCHANIEDKDLLIQNDTLDDASDENLCSGFMFIKSNENTLKYFNPEYVKEISSMSVGWGDQVYINHHKGSLNFGLLPLNLFPNGQYHINHHKTIDPYLIHFNWVLGHKKLVRIIQFNECFSSSLFLLYVRKILFKKVKKRIKRLLPKITN